MRVVNLREREGHAERAAGSVLAAMVERVVDDRNWRDWYLRTLRAAYQAALRSPSARYEDMRSAAAREVGLY